MRTIRVELQGRPIFVLLLFVLSHHEIMISSFTKIMRDIDAIAGGGTENQA